MEDDKVLIQQFVDGDDQALTELVKRHQKALYAFIYRQVRNVDDAADLTQKVLVNVFLKAEQFAGKSSFKTWLYQIALNLCKNHYRTQDRAQFDELQPECEDRHSEQSDQTLAEQEQRYLLKSAVERLPEKQRVTVQLRLYQECTFNEIADIMSCSVGTAKACYHQAVTSLKKVFTEEEHARTAELCNG